MPASITKPSGPVEEIKKQIAAICKSHEAILAAYLFGSYGKGSQKQTSDIDVALLLDETHEHSFSLLSFAVLVERACNRQADMVILNHAGEILKREVRRTGILIYDRAPELRKRFEILGRKTYEDFLYLHREYVNATLYKER